MASPLLKKESVVTFSEPVHHTPHIAIVGCGTMGKIFLQALTKHRNISVVALVDIELDRANRLLNMPLSVDVFDSECEVFTSLESLIESGDVGSKCNAVIIATPGHTHHELVNQALDAGLHCFVESPMAYSVPKSTELVNKARDSMLILHVDLHTRFDPNIKFALMGIGEVRYIRYILKAPIIAAPSIANVTTQNDDNSSDSDIRGLYDLAALAIDAVLYLTAKKTIVQLSCQRISVNPNSNESGSLYIINIQFDDGSVAIIETGFCLPTNDHDFRLEHRLEAFGTNGSRVSNVQNSTLLSGLEPRDGSILWYGPQTDFSVSGFTPSDALAEFIGAVGKTKVSQLSPLLGLRCLQVCSACERSITSGWAVKLKLVASDIVDIETATAISPATSLVFSPNTSQPHAHVHSDSQGDRDTTVTADDTPTPSVDLTAKSQKLARMTLSRWKSMPSFKMNPAQVVRGADLYPPVSREIWKERQVDVSQEKLALDEEEKERQRARLLERIEQKGLSPSVNHGRSISLTLTDTSESASTGAGKEKEKEKEEEVDIDLEDPAVAAATVKIQSIFRKKHATTPSASATPTNPKPEPKPADKVVPADSEGVKLKGKGKVKAKAKVVKSPSAGSGRGRRKGKKA